MGNIIFCENLEGNLAVLPAVEDKSRAVVHRLIAVAYLKILFVLNKAVCV